MEAGYRGEGGSQGYFPQIAGFRVCVDRSQPEGERILSMQLPVGGKWQEIDASTEYTLVVPDFLYGGGDGYRLPQDRPVSRAGSELKYLVLDGILRAQAEGRKVGEAINATNARYVEAGPGRELCW
jgi:5'-nucleotidase